jgi:hypothetical protein
LGFRRPDKLSERWTRIRPDNLFRLRGRFLFLIFAIFFREWVCEEVTGENRIKFKHFIRNVAHIYSVILPGIPGEILGMLSDD